MAQQSPQNQNKAQNQAQNQAQGQAQELRLLAEIAFTGVFYGLTVHAGDIFEYIEQHSEHREIAVLGKGLALISDGKFADAVQTIEKGVLQNNPDSQEGQLFAALALKLSGRASLAEHLSERAAKDGSEEAKKFTQNLRSVIHAQNRPNY